MVDSVSFTKDANREKLYNEIIPQIEALIAGETDLIANFANTAAVLKEVFRFFWVGFYFVKENQLVLGPFQGPLACTRIDFDKGVCGHVFTTREMAIVPNVDEFPGHVACASASRSEIVLPIFDKSGAVFGVLDLDSDLLDDFSQIDADGLGRIVKMLERSI